MDLFTKLAEEEAARHAPLAHRMRPRTLDEFFGQEHIVGPGRLLRRAIEADQLASLIFYGPPGTGKTTLALVIANSTESHFLTINAVLAGVAQIREAIKEARVRREQRGQRTTLFVDEVHRWNKAQQDALLPHVEQGTIILIGATTENPYFEVNKALVSRSRIFQLRPLESPQLLAIARAALADPERGYGDRNVVVDDEALAHLVDVAGGDARSVLGALELAVETTPPDDEGCIHIDLAVAEESIQRRAVLYDKEGDAHYDTISAFIKSVRGSDPDAALYWMAKMVYAGEDPRFIFRRMAILASEDVGLADPQAAAVVAGCWDLYEKVGLPEGRFHLAQAALYLATCPKSNSTMAFFDALRTVGQEREGEVPTHLKDGTRDKKGFGHGEGYQYPHAFRDHWVAQQYLPTGLQGRVFYQPSDQGYERSIGDAVARRREAQLEAMVATAERSDTPGEMLTTSPRDRRKDAWLQRAISDAGRRLGELRDELFDRARVQRHEVILDLNAGGGLLTWEAVRQAPEGGVWAQTADARTGRALREQAHRLPALDRISVVVGALEALPDALASELRFDVVVGRNALTTDLPPAGGAAAREVHWGRWLSRLRQRMTAAGRICLAQVIPSRAERLHALVQWRDDDAALGDQVRAAEEAIYAAADDPRLGWDEEALEAALESTGWRGIAVSVGRRSERLAVHDALIERWFGDGPAAATGAEAPRSRYRDHLAHAGLSDEQIARTAACFRRQLVGREVRWRSAWAIVYARAR